MLQCYGLERIPHIFITSIEHQSRILRQVFAINTDISIIFKRNETRETSNMSLPTSNTILLDHVT